MKEHRVRYSVLVAALLSAAHGLYAAEQNEKVLFRADFEAATAADMWEVGRVAKDESADNGTMVLRTVGTGYGASIQSKFTRTPHFVVGKDTWLAFDYYMPEPIAFRCQVENKGKRADGKKKGNMRREITPVGGEWVHVSFPVHELYAANGSKVIEGDPIVYLNFFMDADPKGDPGLLIDNLTAVEKGVKKEAAPAVAPPAPVAVRPGDRTATRLLYSFEKGQELQELRAKAEGVDLIVVQDNGVTEGKNCSRLTMLKKGGWIDLYLGANAIRNWSDFDYFAMDVYTEDVGRHTLVLELWDQDSRNYATRCTLSGKPTHPGKQTLMWRINRAARNNKSEGLDWHEMEPKDKIQMDRLKKVKFIGTSMKDRDVVFWIDNLRLLQEDAAKPKITVWLPETAVAFDFDGLGNTTPGFKAAGPKTIFKEDEPGSFGFLNSAGLVSGGKGWPDGLTGKFVMAKKGEAFTFKANLPNGDYLVWLCAGKVIQPDMKNRHYLLRLNDAVLCDENPSFKTFCSEEYLYRFMWTPYSERQHAVWHNFIKRMYPATMRQVRVGDGALSLEVQNHFVSALIVVPADSKADFEKMTRQLQEKRIEGYYKPIYTPPQKKPARQAADGPYVAYVPLPWTGVGPSTGPTAKERERTKIVAAAARGQRVIMRLAVTPFEGLGKSQVKVAALTGPGTIPADAVTGYHLNHGSGVLLPSLELDMEKGITQCFWFWLKVPDNAAAGPYTGTFTFVPGQGAPTAVPVELEVYPFTLADILPVSYGMYYGGRSQPAFPEDVKREKLKQQLELMREIGFTAVQAGGPSTYADPDRGVVKLTLNTLFFDLAREVGMGRHPEQRLMVTSLGIGRVIGRRLPGPSHGYGTDRNPGIELKQPGFKDLAIKAYRQYKELLDATGMPYAIEVVDEPREMPNPWNRNLADTITYADLLHEGGLRGTFVTPMGDGSGGKDYTSLVDHIDIVSVHAYPASKGMIRGAREKNKILWLYNTGMDRYSWGFYSWRVGSTGRWEWHFCFGSGAGVGGYPNLEWYNPFGGLRGAAVNAPYWKYRGGVLFKPMFFNVAQGITDYAYLYTLEQAIEKNRGTGANKQTVDEATAFLDALKRVIPEFPKLKGMTSEEDGALVGMGIEGETKQQLDEWRTKIAQYLKVLLK